MVHVSRFRSALFLLAGASASLVWAAPERVAIDYAFVVGNAEKLAASPFKEQRPDLPKFLKKLSYDDYQRIRFIPEQSLWRADNLPFQVQFFHPGGLHQTSVAIHEFSETHKQRIPFVRTFFDYQDLDVPGRLPGSLEYAGFRIIHPLNQPDKFDEAISFLGTNYYRALARHQRYGLSARGVAINSGGPDVEEFPDFIEFWLGKPAADAKSMQLFGLLDGPSVTGAYQFVITPGEETILDVTATLFFRKPVANLGLAPLTSMFWFGENSAHRFGDFRPEVHDSDGLLIATDAETRLWRPLSNPEQPRTTDLDAPALTGFGLLQRDRQFVHYEDTEARYEARPSVWIEPVGPWPPGKVRLFELPARDEYMDNVVASWSPHTPPAAGDRIHLAYRQRWTSALVFGGPQGFVRATRQTVQVERARRTKFVIDFDSVGLEAIPGSADVTAEITTPAGATVLNQHAYRNEVDGSWRLAMLLDAPEVTTPVPLRARLLLEGKPLTETWLNEWKP